MSLRLRVALLTAAVVALIELAIVGSMYAFMSQRLYGQVEDELRGTAATLRPVVSATGDLPRPGQDPERVPNIRRAITADGRVVSARGVVDLPITTIALSVARGDLPSSIEMVRSGGESFSVLTLGAGGGRAVQVARSVASIEAVLQQLLVAAAVLGAAGVVAALAAGAAVATGALAPLRRVSRAVERITRTGDLTRRVGFRGRDEVASFATGFDAMLDRLERMVAELEQVRRAQRQLVADASHELRAPLATLRANVELLNLGADAPVGDRDALLGDTLAGIEDLTALVGQLIDLAREDQRVHARVAVRIDELVRDQIERVRRRYPSVAFRAALEPTTVLGDPEALTRAVANLLDNAGKWTPAGRAVHVDLRAGSLEVRDEGPGIDAADLPHVFERFYRGSRMAAVPGAGLGLAIVAQVMAAHGGQVSARAGDGGGAVFTARFAPASSS